MVCNFLAILSGILQLKYLLNCAPVVAYEQTVMMSWSNPFWEPSADRVLRFQTTANRRLAEAIEQLGRLQEKRKAETASLNLPGPEGSVTAAEPEASTLATEDQLEEASGLPVQPESGGTKPPKSTDVNKSTLGAAQDHPQPNGSDAGGSQ
jgi:hypothetical protein